MNSPFKVPDGFFVDQKDEILNHITGIGVRKPKSRLYYALAVAASLALFIIFYNPNEKENCVTFICLLEQTDFEQLSEQDSQLIDDWISDFEDSELDELEF